MAELHLFGIGVDEVRYMFGASPELAGQLRSIAAERFGESMSEQRPRGTLLGKIGPLFRQPIDPAAVPLGPAAADVENLVAGRSIDPSRLDQCWQIVAGWLDGLSAVSVEAPATAPEMERLEFDLARAGLPSQYSVSRLWARDLGINLRPAPGMQAGYAKNSHVLATRSEMHGIQDNLDAPSRPYLSFILAFLDQFAKLDDERREAGEPELDVVGLWWPGER